MKTRYLIIGSGKMAKHFSHYLKLENLNFLSWSRQANSIEQLNEYKKETQVVLLLISDSAIKPFISTYLTDFNGEIIHFSGALQISGSISLHPLMTFSEHLYDLETYRKIHFVNFSDEEFSHCFPELKNPSSKLNDSAKAYYHSLCVLGGNFAQILWSKMLNEFTQLGIPESAGKNYLQQVFLNFIQQGPGALTGPLVRKDSATIEKNLQALKNDPYQQVYKSMVNAYLGLEIN